MDAHLRLALTVAMLVTFFGQFFVILAIMVVLMRHMKFARAWLDLNRQNLSLTTKTVQDLDDKVDHVEKKTNEIQRELKQGFIDGAKADPPQPPQATGG